MSENVDVSEYMAGGVDIALPDIPMPEPVQEEKKIVNDEVETAFKFCFIGSGQGGGR